MFDITILTESRYVKPTENDIYKINVLKEDNLVRKALENEGLKVHRTNWDDPDFDWETTKYVLFRTTWDYFDRFTEFSKWLNMVSKKTILINQKELIYWNIDKHYLIDLKENGIHIPNTKFIEPGDKRTLEEIVQSSNWDEIILKPAISGAARHTYRFKKNDVPKHADIYSELILNESMILQEYQKNIMSKGEVAYMVFGGRYSHAVLKKAKPGDFRVQDDFGGTVHDYSPSKEEIMFVENAFKAVKPSPLYARVDVIWDNNDELAIGEIELIEPELWFRMKDGSAKVFAEVIFNHIN